MKLLFHFFNIDSRTHIRLNNMQTNSFSSKLKLSKKYYVMAYVSLEFISVTESTGFTNSYELVYCHPNHIQRALKWRYTNSKLKKRNVMLLTLEYNVSFEQLRSQWKNWKKQIVMRECFRHFLRKIIQKYIQNRWNENFTSGLRYQVIKFISSSTSYWYLIKLKTHIFTKMY